MGNRRCRRRRRHLEIQVDIQARKLYLKVFLRFWTPGGRSRRMETGRGSTQNFDARLMSIVVCPGEPFLEKLFRIRKYTLFENGYVPKFQKCQFSKGPVFPGSQVLRMDCFPVYVHSQVLRMD